MSKRTLHFEVPSFLSTNENEVLTLHLGTHLFELLPHSPETLLEAAKVNPAIELIPEAERSRLTHYIAIPEEFFPEDRLLFMQVTSPNDDPEIYLPNLHHVSFYIPLSQRKRRIREALAIYGQHNHVNLSSFGVSTTCMNGLSSTDMEEIHLAADNLISTDDMAKSLLFHHPELASTRPYTASIVMCRHIAPSPDIDPEQYNRLKNLSYSIKRQGNGWTKITDSVDKNGKPLKYEYNLGRRRKGDRVLIYQLSEETERACESPLVGAMNSANDDQRLKGQTWRVNQGFTAIEKDRKTALEMAVGNGPDIWRVVERTPNHGLKILNDTIKFNDHTKEFSIVVLNDYLRTLSAYVQFFKDNGEPINNYSEWRGQLPETFEYLESSSKKYLRLVSSVNSILGIPMPTEPTQLDFVFPKEATTARLFFGSLGRTDWDTEVDQIGAIVTGIFQYGFPILMMGVGALITRTKIFQDFISDRKNLLAVIAIGLEVLDLGVKNKKISLEYALSMCGNAIAGIIVKKGLEKLLLWVTETITVNELENQLPIVGWGLRLAKIAIGLTQVGVAVGEMMSSPATLTVDIKRVMDLKLTLKPDPKHGEIGHPETAVWPALSDHYQITVQYLGGTNFVLKGEMPQVTSSEPLELVFPELPIGGKIQIIAGIYSKTGWLCGKWKSEWLDAFPEQGTKVKMISAHIEEQLTPLTENTQYFYKEKVIYDQNVGKHVWRTGNMPTATIADLNCAVGFKTICKPVDITINSGAYQVGYAWKPAGGDFICQNISILADPESRYKRSEIGFGVQPYITYDQFGQKSANEISSNNFILDTRNNEKHLRQVNLYDGRNGFGLDQSNLLSWGKFSLPSIDAMVVHPNQVVIAVDWNRHKMEILQLPKQGAMDNEAVEALPVSGQGVREGLLKGPKLLSVTPDGRVLVLETLNQRIQSFDTKGNPVPSFIGQKLFTLDAAEHIAELNAGKFSSTLQQQFKLNKLTYVCDLSIKVQADLDQRKLSDNLVKELADEGVYLIYDQKHRDDPKLSSYITVVNPGRSWIITDPNRQIAFSIERSDSTLQVFDVQDKVHVDVRRLGKAWVINDLAAAQSYYIALDENNHNKLNINYYLSYMPLYNPESRTDIEYLEMAIEARGYIYVLSYINFGKKTTDYFLDVYQPDGVFLFRTPDKRLQTGTPQHISAAKLVVDIWRSVYTLNFEAIQGPKNIVEPSISHWCPNPPLFTINARMAALFKQKDIHSIVRIFSENGYQLSSSANIQEIKAAGFWKLKDTWNYDVIQSGEHLHVYQVK